MTNPAVIQNPAREKPLSFASLAARIGRSKTTIGRWTTEGVKGVILETMQLGGHRCTSEEAWVRFCKRQQETTARPHVADARPEPPKPLSRESLRKAAAVGLSPRSRRKPHVQSA